MPHAVTIPFFAFKLHFLSGGNVMIPLHKSGSIRLQQNLQKIAADYSQEFQKHILDKGNYESILEEWQSGDFLQSQVAVNFPAAKDGISYPEFELEFDFFYKKTERGFWMIVPSIRTEAFAETEDQLEMVLITAIKQEFKRVKRLLSVQGIVSAIWYHTIELLQSDISLQFHTPVELEKIEEGNKEEWLPKVATILKVKEQVTYGRSEELNRLWRTMKGNFARNILLVGGSGVGKTALVHDLVFHKKTKDFRGDIWQTSASVLIKELTEDTGWQDNIAHVVKELRLRGDLLFVGNLLELFEVGKYEGNSISIAEYLLTYISRGELNMIGECTEEEKAIIEMRSPNFLSNFQTLSLTEPQQELEGIILKKVMDIADKKEIKINLEAIKETIRLNKRFTPYSGFPGKPIRFLETIILNQVSRFKASDPLEISRGGVIQHFCEETGMPVFLVDPEIPMFPKKIKAQFNNSVFGQEKAVDGVVDMLSAVKTGLSKSGKPIASFLFVGPTGVGKTELAKVLSEFVFGSRNKMVRFDMSEYSSWDAINKLLGNSFYSDGLLTSTVRREPFCVLLFDEIEKAHPDFFDLLLQMLSEGRLTDSRGKLVNFCSTIIIMTSNIGATVMQRRTIGPDSKNQNQEIVQRYVKAVQDYFKPELYNRMDKIIPFEPLSSDTVRFVVEREIEQLKKREGIQYRKMDLEIEDEVLDHLAKVGYDARYGARNLQRALREKLVIPLSRQLNLFDLDDMLVVKISMEKKQLKIQIDADPMGIDLLFEEIEKNDYADLAGNYRRAIQRFKEGYLFSQLMSELDILKRDKEQLKDKFWKEKTRAESYGSLMNLQMEINDLQSGIETLESDFSLASMGLMTYKPEWSEILEDWKTSFFGVKVKTILQSDKGAKNCRFRIFGKNIEPILKFYIQLFDRKDFEYIAHTIWYREKFYQEVIHIEAPDGKILVQPREAYIMKSWEADGNLEPEQPDDQFCGIEFLLFGDCPMLYLQNEKGKQEWKINPKEQYAYISEVATVNAPLPSEIHKRTFMESQPIFRKVNPSLIEDKKLGLKREIGKGNLLDLIIPILDTQFEISVNASVL